MSSSSVTTMTVRGEVVEIRTGGFPLPADAPAAGGNVVVLDTPATRALRQAALDAAGFAGDYASEAEVAIEDGDLVHALECLRCAQTVAQEYGDGTTWLPAILTLSRLVDEAGAESHV